MSNEVAIYLADAPKYLKFGRPDLYGQHAAQPWTWAKREAHHDKNWAFRMLWRLIFFFLDDELVQIFEEEFRTRVVMSLKHSQRRSYGYLLPREPGDSPIEIEPGEWFGAVNWQTSELLGPGLSYAGVRVVFPNDDEQLKRSDIPAYSVPKNDKALEAANSTTDFAARASLPKREKPGAKNREADRIAALRALNFQDGDSVRTRLKELQDKAMELSENFSGRGLGYDAFLDTLKVYKNTENP